MSEEVVLIVMLVVRPDEVEAFHAYEREALQLVGRHGGRIERALALPDSSGGAYRELHVVQFPDEAAYERYAADPDLAAMRPMRDFCIVSTDVIRGRPVAL